MRLYKYLSEENYDKDQIGDILKNECSEYLYTLKDFGSKEKIIDYMLYRGTSSHYPDNGITKVKPRKNRKPKDMPEELHEMLDELFEKKFGWPVRSQGVFATSDKEMAENFGRSAFPFFPVNGFEFVYSKTVSDLLTELEVEGVLIEISPSKGVIKTPGAGEEEDEEDIDGDTIRMTLKTIIGKYTNKNLNKAMKARLEVAFNCKYYYLVEQDLAMPIAEKLAGI